MFEDNHEIAEVKDFRIMTSSSLRCQYFRICTAWRQMRQRTANSEIQRVSVCILELVPSKVDELRAYRT